jgi:hypothetical protein
MLERKVMMSIPRNLDKVVKDSIRTLLIDFRKDGKGTFNSESDIKCYLYHLLVEKIFRLSGYVIRTEMPNGKGQRYDMVVLSKDTPLVAIEIKFNPMATKSLKKNGSIYKDIRKLKDISSGHLLILSHRKYDEALKNAYDELMKRKQKGLVITIGHVSQENSEVKYQYLKN